MRESFILHVAVKESFYPAPPPLQKKIKINKNKNYINNNFDEQDWLQLFCNLNISPKNFTCPSG